MKRLHSPHSFQHISHIHQIPHISSRELQLANDILPAAEFVDAPEYVADVNADGAVQVFIEGDLVAEGFVVAVEGQADEFAVGVQHG